MITAADADASPENLRAAIQFDGGGWVMGT